MFRKLYEINMSMTNYRYVAEFVIFDDLVEYSELIFEYIYSCLYKFLVRENDSKSYIFEFMDAADMFYY